MQVAMLIKPVSPITRIYKRKHEMPRNLNKVKRDQYVFVLCIDTDKDVEAKIIFQDINKLVVELPQGIRLTLDRHPRQPKIFVGHSNGMTFECQLD